MSNREKFKKPDDMSDEFFEMLMESTSSLTDIRSNAKADVEDYLANPDGRSKGLDASGLPTPGAFPTLLLTGIGRKSGEERTTPLVFLENSDDKVVVGSLAGHDEAPAWVLNLDANPDCWVQLDRDKMTATARNATDAEREELWPKLVEIFPTWGFFQSQCDRPFAIVILSPTGPA
jgi:deazaflavin-dependent oxidoreductase (nitroreductase family)